MVELHPITVTVKCLGKIKVPEACLPIHTMGSRHQHIYIEYDRNGSVMRYMMVCFMPQMS
jgi:hypothetical protein